MASIGHVVAGISIARLHDGEFRWRSMLAFGAFSLLPDLDVVAFKFGIPYADPFGHRGATHSIAFAVLTGIIAWLLTRSWRTTLAMFATVLSHPLLDMLTDGGLGVALWWPLRNERYFFPWTPLPVAPIGKGMLSMRGLYVTVIESMVFFPLLILASFTGRRRPSTSPWK